MMRPSPIMKIGDKRLPRKITDARMPITGTPSVKLDMANTLMRRPYSAEITKQADVAMGPIKKSNSIK